MPYEHRIDTTLSLLKKTVNHKSNPKTRTLCFWKISSTDGRVSNWNRDARLENQGSVGKGGKAQRETEHQIWQNAFTIQPWIWFPPKFPLNHGALSHGINYAPHSHQHYHCKTYTGCILFLSYSPWGWQLQCKLKHWNNNTLHRHLNSEIQNHTLDTGHRKTIAR